MLDMPSISPHFLLKFQGGGIAPPAVSASELARVIRAFEGLISSVASEPGLQVSLVSVGEGSLELGFRASKKVLGQGAFHVVAESIAHGRAWALPSKTRKVLRQIQVFTKSHECVALIRSNGSSLEVTPSTDFPEPSSATFQGGTTLYGRVEKIDGRKLEVEIRTERFGSVPCRATEPQVKKLAQRIFEIVGLSGWGRWEIPDFKIGRFTVESILDYRETNFREAMDWLTEQLGERWRDVLDVQEAIQRYRSGEE